MKNCGRIPVPCLMLVLGMALAFHRACAVEVHLEMDPTTLSMNDSAELRVTVEGSASVSTPNMPNVPGLRIVYSGQSSQFQFINGVMTAGVTFLYNVFPEKEGTFTLPEITIQAGKERVKTKPLTVTVSGGRQSFVPPPMSSPPPSSSTPPDASEDHPLSAAWIKLEYPQRDFYVGEMIPVKLKVYIRDGLRVVDNSMPRFSGTAFTFSKLGKAREEVEAVEGQAYHVYTWDSAIAAVKTGKHPLGAQMDLMILVTVRNRSRMPRGFFNDPFFDQFFDSDVQQKKVTLASPENQEVQVSPLPAEGKPDNFDGAIGEFAMSVDVNPKEVAAGDPVTVRTILSGSGNFDRVHAPAISKSDSLKTYPPNAKFEEGDEVGFTGKKIFEQMIIPKSADFKEVPPIAFSYFDPVKKKYRSLDVPSIPIQVKGIMASPSSPRPAASPAPVTTFRSKGNQTGAAELVANQLELKGRSSWRSVLFRPWFIILGLAPLIALGGFWIVSWRDDRMSRDPSFARSVRTGRVVREILQEVREAGSKGDVSRFFHAGRRALQMKMGDMLGMNEETVTVADIERLPVDESVRVSLRNFFSTSDAISYSGTTPGGMPLPEWEKALLAMIQALGGTKSGSKIMTSNSVQ